MDGEHICTNRRQGPKTGCLLRSTEDRAKTVSFETPNTVFTNLAPLAVLGRNGNVFQDILHARSPQ